MNTFLDTFRGYLAAQATISTDAPRSADLPVVTISRETGAGAITIAHLVAERLNRVAHKDECPWTVFDRNLIEKVLEDHDLPGAIKRFVQEDATVFSPRRIVEELLGLHPSDWTLLHHTTDTILRLAQLGNVILVGRGASVITSHLKNALHVRLVGALDARIKHITEYYKLTEKEAAAFLHKKDQARRRYVKHYFHVPIDDPLQYHATINSHTITFERAAQMIADAVLFPKGVILPRT